MMSTTLDTMADSRVVSFRLRHLKLDTAEDVQKIFEDEGVDPARVEELDMSGNTIGGLAGKELGALIGRMPLLKVANLSDIITNRSIEEVSLAISYICDGLVQCKELIELDFSHNAFGTRVAPILAPFLSKHVSLQVLKLNNNGFSPEAGNVIAQALLDMAKYGETIGQPTSLRVLLLMKNRWEDGSASTWGEVLAAHKNLQKVKFANNGFKEPGVIAIAQGLTKCQDLRHIRVSDCSAYESAHISTEESGKRGWHFIAGLLRSFRDLEVLDLSDSGLTEDGCTELLRVLGETPHSHLHTLVLVNNDMGSSHYKTLNKILDTHLPALKLLDLALNEDLEDEDFVELSKHLEDRGGQVLLYDIEEEDEMEHKWHVHGEASDAEKEVQFIAQTSQETTKSGFDSVVDDLADLVSTSLKIDENNKDSDNSDA